MKTSASAACAAFVAAFVFGIPAAAQEWPMPKMFKNMSQQKGQFQVETLEGGPSKGGMPKMTICTDNVAKQSAGPAAKDKGYKSECKHRLLKDTADEAVIESTCPERTTKMTFTRESAKSVIMTMDTKSKRGDQHMKMRYTHLGPCREGQATMTLDKNSEQCQKIRAQAAKMDPAKQCAKQQGANRQECESRVRDAVAQMSAMCN